MIKCTENQSKTNHNKLESRVDKESQQKMHQLQLDKEEHSRVIQEFNQHQGYNSPEQTDQKIPPDNARRIVMSPTEAEL